MYPRICLSKVSKWKENEQRMDIQVFFEGLPIFLKRVDIQSSSSRSYGYPYKRRRWFRRPSILFGWFQSNDLRGVRKNKNELRQRTLQEMRGARSFRRNGTGGTISSNSPLKCAFWKGVLFHILISKRSFPQILEPSRGSLASSD